MAGLCNNKNYYRLQILIPTMFNLSSLQPGENALIHSIHADESLFQRFNALGFRIGKKIELVRRASFNGPLHVRIGTTDVILRASEAHLIHITQ